PRHPPDLHSLPTRRSSDLHLHVPGDEDVEREPQIVHQPRMHAADLLQPLGRELQPVADLLVGELHQVLVDDVADMLEICGESDEDRKSTRLNSSHVKISYA